MTTEAAPKTASRLRFIVPLAILVIAAALVFRGCSPGLIHGDVLDMTVATDSHGKQMLWLVTDDSWHYSVKSSGSIGSGSMHCFACKTWTYLYDPIAKKVIKRTKTSLDGPITRAHVFQHKDRVWVVLPSYHTDDARLEQYDADTGEQVLDTAGFVAQFPELSAGLVDISYDPKALTFKTKDGRDRLTYSLVTDKMYAGSSPDSAALGPIAAMKDDSNSSARKTLVLTSPSDTWHEKGVAIGSRVYLEGILYYQDADCAAIIHLDQVGKKANRMLTLVDLENKRELWTVKQDNLFPGMKIDETSNTFSSLFFTKDEMKVARSASVIILMLNKVGAMAFDYATGKKLWTVYP